jgi:predicted Rossmann fold flavoprotein
VAVLEHNGQVGRKILISGGGRCNFTNIHCGPGNFTSENPHFAKSALARYKPQHFLELVDRYGIAWHEKKLGQLFCDHSARAIVDMLVEECAVGGVEIVLNARGIEVERDGSYRVSCAAGEFSADALVIATGGLSIPKMGATGFGYELARKFGLKVIEPRAALVPLVLGGIEADWTQLAGVSADVEVTAGKAIFREKMLATHWGLSGPAILQASTYWREGAELVVDFAPGRSVVEELKLPGGRKTVAAFIQALRDVMPQRMAEFVAERVGITGWSNIEIDEYEHRLHSWQFCPVKTEGFEKAEVTAGGVDTNEISARTMESRRVSGLFFIGEVVDVTGWLGGFNFQWAWASAVAAGQAV